MSKDDTVDANNWKRTRSEEQQMRQFLKIETGLGNSNGFRRGWIFNFEFTEQQKAAVNGLMGSGMSFEEAFDHVREHE